MRSLSDEERERLLSAASSVPGIVLRGRSREVVDRMILRGWIVWAELRESVLIEGTRSNIVSQITREGMRVLRIDDAYRWSMLLKSG